MDTTKTIVLEFRMTRNRLLGLLSFLLLTWHPGFLGSEVLTLTTYYPAPYGGYVNLLTTNKTLLARDGGAVGIGTGAAALNASYKLTVSASGAMGGIGGNYGLTPDYAAWAAYGTGAGGAAIYNDSAGFKKLMIVGNNSAGGTRQVGIWDDLTVAGTINPGTALTGLCEWITYTIGGGQTCNANERVVGYYGDGNSHITGYLPSSKTSEGGGTWISLGEDWNGTMICCRFAQP